MYKAGVVVLLWMLMFSAGFAQTTGKPTVKPPTRRPSPVAKIPKTVSLATRFGPYRTGTPVLLNDIIRVLSTSLVVTDTLNNQNWQVVKYRLGWMRREVSDNIKTGKKDLVQSFNATDIYDSDKIPLAWQDEMKAFLQTGEALFFEEIIARHPSGEQRKAKSLILKIK